MWGVVTVGFFATVDTVNKKHKAQTQKVFGQVINRQSPAVNFDVCLKKNQLKSRHLLQLRLKWLPLPLPLL